MKNIILFPILLLSFCIAVSCCPCRKASSRRVLLDEDSSWRSIQIAGKAVQSDGYTLIFAQEGKLMGVGDCNRIMGEWQSDDNRSISLLNIATTRAMCEDSQGERVFLESLGRVDSYAIDGDKLLLLDEGSVTIILERYE